MKRYHDLDALRGFAMLLGLVLHAATFLIPISGFWPVQDPWAQTTPPEANGYAYLIIAIHGFRMPVFFLVSGFFTAMLWRSRGAARLARHRVRRILIPLGVSALTIVPVTEWLFEPEGFALWRWPLVWLGGVHHLWFLWYLTLIAGIFLVVVQLPVRFRRSWWWLLVPLTLWPQHLMVSPGIGADTPTQSLVPDLQVLGYYAVFFFFGAFFRERGFEVRSWWAAAIPVSVLVVFPLALVTVFSEVFLPANPWWAPVAASVFQISYAWLMSFGFMGLFRWVASKERFWIRYLSDSSYWLYIAHIPLVILCQQLVVDWPVSAHLKFLLVLVAVTGALLLTYQFAVRYTAIGNMLNGPRQRRTRAAPQATLP